MADALSDYGYNKGAASTSDGSASLTGFPSFVRLEQGTDSTGTGPGGLDPNASINGQEDIGFFDENGNPLDFYFVTFDTTNGIFEAWVRTDLVRDGNLDIQVGYGNGSTVDTVAESTLWDNVPDLLMRLSLDGDANDSTSNNHDGNLNGVTSISDGPFNHSAYDFGSGDYIDVGDANTLDLVGRNMTMLAWIRTTDTSRGGVIRKNNSSNWQPVYEIEINRSAADDYRMMNANNSTDGGVDYSLNVSGITDGTWKPLMATYDDVNTQGQMYVKGNNVASPTGNAPADDTTGALQIGRMAQATLSTTNSTSGDYIGDIAEVMLFNGVKSQAWGQAHWDMSPESNYGLFSWNASSATDTVGSVYETSSSGVKKTTSNGVFKTNASA